MESQNAIFQNAVTEAREAFTAAYTTEEVVVAPAPKAKKAKTAAA